MMKKRDWIFVVIVVCIAIGAFVYFDRVQISDAARRLNREPLPKAIDYQDATTPSPSFTGGERLSALSSLAKGRSGGVALSLNLAVPFTSQAPTADWSQPYQDACEEASVLMVREFYAGNKSSTIASAMANKAILDLVARENKLFGYFIDTTVAETAQFAESMYGYAKSEIIENPTIDQIKTYLNQGNPVIVPAAGQLLKNPYFTAPGPVYHMLVIRGYTKDKKFIVNDPGTKRGKEYLYSFETIMNAMHDWNKNGDVLQGRKAILILHPKS